MLAMAHRGLGVLAGREDDPKEAVTHLARAGELNPEDPDAWAYIHRPIEGRSDPRSRDGLRSRGPDSRIGFWFSSGWWV